MRFKLTGLGIASLVIYTIFNIYNAATPAYDAETIALLSMYGGQSTAYYEDMNTWSMISALLGLLAIIPSIDYLIKAFKKHARGEEYAISSLSVVLTVLSFGMPFFMYAFTSWIMKKAFGTNERYTSEMWGFWVLSIFTFGIIWVVMFFAIGPALFIYRYITKDIYKLEESSGLEMASLILGTIITLGFLWLIIGLGIVFMRFFFVKAWNNVMEAEIEFKGGVKVWFWILSILSIGLLPLGNFISYWTYEIFLFNAEDQIPSGA